MMKIGSHISSAKGYEAMGKQALKLGASTFAFFTRNPRGGSAKAIEEADVQRFLDLWSEKGYGKIVAHAPYTLNPCSNKPEVRRFAREAFSEDLERMEHTPGNYYNFHPGSHTGAGREAGIRNIIAGLDQAITGKEKIHVLLETMTGKGTEIGSRFEDLKEIRENAAHPERIGICLDTCHIFAAGYDVIHDLDGVLKEFDRVLGLENLRAVHLNDSLMPFGSHKDRHAVLGGGEIGMETLLEVVRHPALKELPFYLETPLDDEGHAQEIARLREQL